MGSHCSEHQQMAGSFHPELSLLELFKFAQEETLITKLIVISFPKTVKVYIIRSPRAEEKTLHCLVLDETVLYVKIKALFFLMHFSFSPPQSTVCLEKFKSLTIYIRNTIFYQQDIKCLMFTKFIVLSST